MIGKFLVLFVDDICTIVYTQESDSDVILVRNHWYWYNHKCHNLTNSYWTFTSDTNSKLPWQILLLTSENENIWIYIQYH